MANEVDIDIGSFNLDFNNQIAIAGINLKVAKQLSLKPLPKAHGSVLEIGNREDITVKINGTVAGTDYDTLRSNMDALQAALYNQTDEYKLTLDDDRFLMVQYRNFSQGWKNFRRLATFSFDLIAADPFWYSETLNSSSAVRSNGVGFTITNNGNAPTRAKITFTIGGTPVSNDLMLVNETTGETFEFTGAVAAADLLVLNNRVDQRRFTVLNDGVDELLFFEGDPMTLAPGANTLKFYSAVGGITTKVEHRDAWL